MCIDEHENMWHDLVDVDSKTLVSFLLFYFTLFSLCFIFFFLSKIKFLSFWN
jgi:hypothetical protein